MRIIFYGGRQAGAVSLLTLLALGHKVVCVIPVDEPVESVARSFALSVKKPTNINEEKFVEYVKKLKPDLFVCCHGRQILKTPLLNTVKALNMHPCLYKYKGADPIKRLLEDGNKKASVGIHWMTEKVDRGKVLVEKFKNIESNSIVGVYNELYPLYSQTLVEALSKITKRNLKRTREA